MKIKLNIFKFSGFITYTATGVAHENSDLQKYKMMKEGESLTVTIYGDDAYPFLGSHEVSGGQQKFSSCELGNTVIAGISKDFAEKSNTVSSHTNYM